MKLILLPEAERALLEIASWVEQQNTPGSGYRFAEKFIDNINAFALPNVKYAMCAYKPLRDLGLQCIAIDDWIIAFTSTPTKFIVHYIIHGTGLR